MSHGSEEQHDTSPRLDEAIKKKLEGLIPEVLKRTFYAGLGAVFTTEEGIRKLANEFSLPKDVVTYLFQQAQSTKDDLFRIVATELRGFLESLNLNEELQRLLTSLSFEIKTEIRFIPNDAKIVKPQLKKKISVKRKSTGVDEESVQTNSSDQTDSMKEPKERNVRGEKAEKGVSASKEDKALE